MVVIYTRVLDLFDPQCLQLSGHPLLTFTPSSLLRTEDLGACTPPVSQIKQSVSLVTISASSPQPDRIIQLHTVDNTTLRFILRDTNNRCRNDFSSIRMSYVEMTIGGISIPYLNILQKKVGLNVEHPNTDSLSAVGVSPALLAIKWVEGNYLRRTCAMVTVRRRESQLWKTFGFGFTARPRQPDSSLKNAASAKSASTGSSNTGAWLRFAWLLQRNSSRNWQQTALDRVRSVAWRKQQGSFEVDSVVGWLNFHAFVNFACSVLRVPQNDLAGKLQTWVIIVGYHKQTTCRCYRSRQGSGLSSVGLVKKTYQFLMRPCHYACHGLPCRIRCY